MQFGLNCNSTNAERLIKGRLLKELLVALRLQNKTIKKYLNTNNKRCNGMISIVRFTITHCDVDTNNNVNQSGDLNGSLT